MRGRQSQQRAVAPSRGRDRIVSRSGMRQYQPMTELTDVSGAFGYGDSILVGERVRLRGARDDDLPALATWEMDPGRMATLSSWVAPPSEAAAKERNDALKRENVERVRQKLLAMTVGNGWRIAYCYVGKESSAAIEKGCTVAETGGNNWHWGPYTTFSPVDPGMEIRIKASGKI